MNIELIESIRKKKGLTQAQMAKSIGYSTAGYQKMIYTNDIKVSVLEKITKLFGLEIQVFFNTSNNKSGKKDYVPTLDVDIADENFEVFKRANALQQELLACYKIISDMQHKILLASQIKVKSKTRLETKRKFKRKK